MGLPHSTTLARIAGCRSVREIVECGSPMPLLTQETISALFDLWNRFGPDNHGFA
jgi:hypothetical protein